MADGDRHRWGRLLLAALLIGLLAACAAKPSPEPPVALVSPSASLAQPSPAGTDEPALGFSIGAQAPAIAPGPSATTAPVSMLPSEPPVRWPLPLPGQVPPPGFTLHVPILMYHRIVPLALAGDSLPSLVVSPALFAEQLGALHAAGWRTVTVAALAAALETGRSLPPRTFTISLDDGWRDGLTYALPILQRFGDVATFYVVSDRLADPSFLSAGDLRVLVAAGMEIGDHTADHVDLVKSSAAALHEEVEADANAIATAVGERPATLAYPFGSFDARVMAEVARDGFGLALTTLSGSLEDGADRFEAPRLRVGPGTSAGSLLAEVGRTRWLV